MRSKTKVRREYITISETWKARAVELYVREQHRAKTKTIINKTEVGTTGAMDGKTKESN